MSTFSVPLVLLFSLALLFSSHSTVSAQSGVASLTLFNDTSCITPYPTTDYNFVNITFPSSSCFVTAPGQVGLSAQWNSLQGSFTVNHPEYNQSSAYVQYFYGGTSTCNASARYSVMAYAFGNTWTPSTCLRATLSQWNTPNNGYSLSQTLGVQLNYVPNSSASGHVVSFSLLIMLAVWLCVCWQ